MCIYYEQLLFWTIKILILSPSLPRSNFLYQNVINPSFTFQSFKFQVKKKGEQKVNSEKVFFFFCAQVKKLLYKRLKHIFLYIKKLFTFYWISSPTQPSIPFTLSSSFEFLYNQKKKTHHNLLHLHSSLSLWTSTSSSLCLCHGIRQ